VRSYRSLEAWKVAHQALLVTLRATDAANHPKTWALFDKHMRIAFGSAAEAACLVLAAGEAGYLEREVVEELEGALGDCMRLLFGLMKGRREKSATPNAPPPTP
jgi:hypothetical protein